MNENQHVPTGKKSEPNMWSMLGLVFELGYIIAIPAFLFGFGGAYLDKHFGSSPLFVLLGLFLALAASGLTIWRKLQSILSRL